MCNEIRVQCLICPANHGYGRKLATDMANGQCRAIIDRYGENLDANSHGESFLKLFEQRLVPGGLYLLDEPEAPVGVTYLRSTLVMFDAIQPARLFCYCSRHPR